MAFVLILVLLDDGLGQRGFLQHAVELSHVLILVLLDDGLGQVRQLREAAVIKGS